jgi:hypothetical protein
MQGVCVAQQASRRQLVFIGAAAAASGSAVTYHASSLEGDLLVAIVSSTIDPGAISGWTRNLNYQFPAGGNSYFVSVYTKIKGTDTSFAAIGSGGRNVVVTYRGTSQVPSVGTVGTVAEGDVNPLNAPAITPQDILSTVIAICSDQATITPPTSPGGGFTNRSGGQAGTFYVLVDDKQFASTSSTGTVAYGRTTGTAHAMAVLIEIKP